MTVDNILLPSIYGFSTLRQQLNSEFYIFSRFKTCHSKTSQKHRHRETRWVSSIASDEGLATLHRSFDEKPLHCAMAKSCVLMDTAKPNKNKFQKIFFEELSKLARIFFLFAVVLCMMLIFRCLKRSSRFVFLIAQAI